MFTDATDKFWAGFVTQVEKDQITKEFQRQKNQPLAFLGRRFSRTQENWTTYENDAFAIVTVFEKLTMSFGDLAQYKSVLITITCSVSLFFSNYGQTRPDMCFGKYTDGASTGPLLNS